jgi:hypothetical protein
MTPWRLPYTDALDRFQADAIVAAMTDDVVIRVAVHDEPMQTKPVAEFLFGVLAKELGAVCVTDEIVEGTKAVVLFETSIGGGPVQGLNVLEHDDAGLVRELTVFFRPLEGLQQIAQVVGGHMEQRFGPPQ